jgi:hypothetical protein
MADFNFHGDKKGKNMENQIRCPACKRTITNNVVVESAAKGEDHRMGSEYVVCECGERISFWAITAQLRNQKKPVERALQWFRSFSKG